MLTLRKFDLYGQLILGGLMILSIPVLVIYGLLFGLLILGVWQFASAVLNTHAFLQNGMKSNILTYWILAGVDLGVLGYTTLFEDTLGNEFTTLLSTIVLCAAGAIAIYYWIIERRLILELEIRRELSAFTKSKA